MNTLERWKIVPIKPTKEMLKEAKRAVTGPAGAVLRSQEEIFTAQYQLALAAAPTPPAQEEVAYLHKEVTQDQEDEPVAWAPVHPGLGVLFGATSKHKALAEGCGDLSTIPLYTRPQSDKLRKAAEEFIDYFASNEERSIEEVFEFIGRHEENLRAALEDK